jgi:SanA protein
MNYQRLRKTAIAVIGVFVFLILLFGILNVYVYEKGVSYLKTSISQLPRSEAIIIPGAAILKNDSLSPILKERADAALVLYRAGKAPKILVTGANPTLSYDEVSPVRRYLVKAGVPPQDIFLDHAGFNTYSSMYRARSVFDVDSAIIVSQDFHLPRAIYIARSLGINAYGFSGDQGTYLFKNDIRELFARPYAVFNVIFHVKPKYLGASFPISGDGQATWQ